MKYEFLFPQRKYALISEGDPTAGSELRRSSAISLPLITFRAHVYLCRPSCMANCLHDSRVSTLGSSFTPPRFVNSCTFLRSVCVSRCIRRSVIIVGEVNHESLFQEVFRSGSVWGHFKDFHQCRFLFYSSYVRLKERFLDPHWYWGFQASVISHSSAQLPYKNLWALYTLILCVSSRRVYIEYKLLDLSIEGKSAISIPLVVSNQDLTSVFFMLNDILIVHQDSSCG